MRTRLANTGAYALLVVVVLLSRGPTAAAQQRALWLEPGPEAVLPRVRGQLSDLGFEVEPVTLEDRSGAALHALANEHGARAVLWAEELPPNGLRLLVYEPEQHKLFRRTFPMPDVASGRSAAIEALAVGVRSALLALMAGEAAGEVVEPGARSAAAEPSATAQTPPGDGALGAAAAASTERAEGTRDHSAGDVNSASDADDDEGDEAGDTRRARGVWAELGAGWRVGGDGLGLVQGPSVALRGGYARWSIELGYAAGLTRELTLEGAVLALHEHRALAALQLVMPVAPKLDVVPGLGGGFLALTRDTGSLPDNLMATPATTTLSGLLEASCALRWYALRARTWTLGIELGGSATLVLAPPTLRVQTATGLAEREASRVQPAGRLQLFIHFPGLSSP